MKHVLCPLRKAARSLVDRPAIITPQLTLSYLELDSVVQKTIVTLQKLGVRKNSRVAILSINSASYVILLWSLWRMKAVPVLLSTRLPLATIKQEIRKISARFLFVDSEGRLEKGANTWRVNSIVLLETILEVIRDSQTRDKDLRARIYYSLKQNATIMFTSGTTSLPKAALHTFGNHYYSAAGSNLNISLGSGDRWLLSLPLYHVGGLGIVFRVILSGASLVIPDTGSELSGILEKFKITHVSFVTTQLERLLRRRWKGRRSLKAVLLGGSAVPSNLIDRALKVHLPVFISYGLTEMSSQVATSSFQISGQWSVVSGRENNPGLPATGYQLPAKVLRYRKVKIAKDGEILVKGETLFKGYIQGNRVVRPRVEGGWFPTGDLGGLTKDGYLKVTGRKDYMFISGGENIQPEEIEKYLTRYPGIEAALVVPRQDAEFGFRPVAYIKGNNKKWNGVTLRKFLLKSLPKFKVPDVFYPWPEGLEKETSKAARNIFKVTLARSRNKS